MNQSFLITPNVINTLKSLPAEEAVAITAALASEIMLGASAKEDLTPSQPLVYNIIRDYVDRDTRRFSAC